MRGSSKLLCRSNFSWGTSQIAPDPLNTGHVVSYRISSYLPLQFLLPRFSCVICILNCTRAVPLNMNLNVSTGIIFADTQNLVALRMSFDGVTSFFLLFFQFLNTTFVQFLTFQTSNNRQKSTRLQRNVDCYDVIRRLQEFNANLPIFCQPN